MSNKEVAEELHKSIIRKFNERKVRSSFINNIWRTDLADMQLISKFNEEIAFIIIIIFSKYTRVISLKDEKSITITNAFEKNLKESNRKPNKIWMNKAIEFYNRSMKSWLEENDIEIYPTHNEVKYAVAERSIRILKSKIDKYMISILKNVFIDQLNGIVNKYNNTYHSTIKMKPVDVKSSTYIDSSKKINEKDPKFKIVVFFEYQNIKTFLEKAMF